MIVFVLAVDENFGIGKGDGLPWSFKKDMQFFKALTEGFQVAIGRKTWEAIKEPSKGMPGRRKIVIGKTDQESSQSQLGGIYDTLYFQSINEIVRYSRDNGTIMVIGGKQLYETLMPLADIVIATQVHKKFNCDVFVDSDIQKLSPNRLASYTVKDVDRITQNPVNLSFNIYGASNVSKIPADVNYAYQRGIASVKEWFDPGFGS